jgi:hypothetical protein
MTTGSSDLSDMARIVERSQLAAAQAADQFTSQIAALNSGYIQRLLETAEAISSSCIC